MRGHIRTRGENTHQLIYYVGRKPDGRPDYRSTTFHGSKRDAEIHLANIISSIGKGEYAAPTKETVGQFLNRWLEAIQPPVIEEKTWKWYKTNCKMHLIPKLGHIQLAKLTPLQIQAAYRELLDGGRAAKSQGGEPGDPLSPNTVRGIHRTMHRALGQAVEWGLLAQNPAAKVKQPKEVKTDRRVLIPEEAARLLDVSHPTGRYSLYLAAITSGLRQGELLGLRWRDVDLDRGVATVRQELKKAGKNPQFKPPKTPSSFRAVSLPQSLVAALRELRRQQEEERELFGASYRDYDLIWTVPGGGPISPRNLDRQLKSLLRKAGLPDMRFHDLRHTHTSLLARAGVHPKVAQERVGHAQSTLTMDIYTHTTAGMQEAAAAAIDKLLVAGAARAKKQRRVAAKT